MNVKKIFACALAMIAMSLQVISGNPEPAPKPGDEYTPRK